mgnify:CR=1 FL=1
MSKWRPSYMQGPLVGKILSGRFAHHEVLRINLPEKKLQWLFNIIFKTDASVIQSMCYRGHSVAYRQHRPDMPASKAFMCSQCFFNHFGVDCLGLRGMVAEALGVRGMAWWQWL